MNSTTTTQTATAVRTATGILVTFPDGTTATENGKRAKAAAAVSVGQWSSDGIWVHGTHGTEAAARKCVANYSKPRHAGGAYWLTPQVLPIIEAQPEAPAAVEVGKGCGTGSDGEACSPAYLCPACIDLLIAAEDSERANQLEGVRAIYGDTAADLVADGWTVDSAIAHVSGTCDLAICGGDHGAAWATVVTTTVARPEVTEADHAAKLERSLAAVREAAVAAGRQDVLDALEGVTA